MLQKNVKKASIHLVPTQSFPACVHHGVRNVSFLENFTYVVNKLYLLALQ